MGKIIEYSKNDWEEAKVETSATRFLKQLFRSLDDEYDARNPINLTNILTNMGIDVVDVEGSHYIAYLDTAQSPNLLCLGEGAYSNPQIYFSIMAATAMHVFEQRKFVEENYNTEIATDEVLEEVRDMLTEQVEDLKIPSRLVSFKKRLTLSDKKLYKKVLIDEGVNTLRTKEGYEDFKRTLIEPIYFENGFLEGMTSSTDEATRVKGKIIETIAKKDAEYNLVNSHDFEM